MRHAIGALFILAGSVTVPVRRLHQLLERTDVSLAQEIAGLLPAEDVARGHAPRRAVELAIASEKVQEDAGMHQLPLLALAQREDAAKQFLGLAAIEEM